MRPRGRGGCGALAAPEGGRPSVATSADDPRVAAEFLETAPSDGLGDQHLGSSNSFVTAHIRSANLTA